MKQTLGERVRTLRKHYGHSQKTFASEIGLSDHVPISDIERGVTKTPQEETINKIVQAYGTTKQWLLHGTGEMLPEGMITQTDTVEFKAGPNPYKDYALKEKEKEAEKWYNEYLDMKNMLRSTLASLGKPNAISGTAQQYLKAG